MMSNTDTYLRAMMSLIARKTFPPDDLAEIVVTSDRQLDAFNMCDGTKSQSEIAKALGLDKGSFSRTMSRWIEEGVVIKVSTSDGDRPVHVYPLPARYKKEKGK